MPYQPMPEHPWPTHDGWIVAWWSNEYDSWNAGVLRSDRDAALKRLQEVREKNPDMVFRLVHETTTYTAEED